MNYHLTAISMDGMSRQIPMNVTTLHYAIATAKDELKSPYNKAVVVRDENEQAVFSDFKK